MIRVRGLSHEKRSSAMNQFNTFVRLWAVAGGAIMLLIVAVTAVNVGAFCFGCRLAFFWLAHSALPAMKILSVWLSAPLCSCYFPIANCSAGILRLIFLPPDYHPRCGAVWIYLGLDYGGAGRFFRIFHAAGHVGDLRR